jgi:hypothetical protein
MGEAADHVGQLVPRARYHLLVVNLRVRRTIEVKYSDETAFGSRQRMFTSV